MFDGRKRSPWRRLVLLLLLLCGGVMGCHRAKWVTVEGKALGMTWRAQVEGVTSEQVRKQVEDCLARWERATSLWRADSEITQFNRAPAGRWVQVGPELWQAVEIALEVAEQTDGALSITMEPLSNLWGFGPGVGKGKLPTEEQIAQVLADCHWSNLQRDATQRALKKRVAGLRLDVNAVVEGLVLDELAKGLRAQGGQHFLLELGGELLAAGQSPQGGPWVAGVQSPEGGVDEVMAPVVLQDEALSTSGTYRQQREQEGQRVTHVLHPGLGRPVSHRLVSVSVAHPRAALADAYATALLVLGPSKGRRVAEQLGLRVFWVEAAP